MNDTTDDLAPADETTPRIARVRRTRRALWIAVAVGVLLAGLVVTLATRDPAAQRAVDSPLLGKPAPAIDADTVDGGHVNLDDYRGRWVLVNYFATWCVPCREEHPDLVRFSDRHHTRGDAEVIGVVFSDSYDAVRDFRRDNGGDWPMAKDPGGRISLDWGVSGVPESFLVDPDGIVRAKVVGGVTEARLEALLADATGGR